MCATKIDTPQEINQQRWKWRRRAAFPTRRISFPTESRHACRAPAPRERLYVKWPQHACACAYVRSHAKGEVIALFSGLSCWKFPYIVNMEIIWQLGYRCATVLVRNVKGPVVATVSHTDCSQPTGCGDNMRQTAQTISFSILRSTLPIDDPWVRLKLINLSTWVILSKAKLCLKALSISRYLPNGRLKKKRKEKRESVEQCSKMENCLQFKCK